jgi:hypothetical protein
MSMALCAQNMEKCCQFSVGLSLASVEPSENLQANPNFLVNAVRKLGTLPHFSMFSRHFDIQHFSMSEYNAGKQA